MITNHGLQLMGFEPFPAGESIRAAFHLLRVYEVRGIKVDATDKCVIFGGTGCRFAIGNSVNAITEAMLGDTFTDDEAEWSKKKGVTPPYLMVHVGPTPVATATQGMFQRKDGAIITHDCFTAAKEELKQLEPTTVEPLIVALSAAFSGNPHPVTFHECGREVFGLTDVGETVFDMRFMLSGSLSVSSTISENALARTVEYARGLQKSLDVSIGRFYFVGLSEKDPLKRFLYFFLFIERYTHGAFASLSGHKGSADIFQAPARLSATVEGLAADTLQSTKSLVPRFIWCALLAWPSITDDDVRIFKELKRERDHLSHGVRTSVDLALATRAERLAARLIVAGGPPPQTTA